MSADIAESNCLVVGGAGFVGSALVRLLLAKGAGKVLIVDNLLSSDRSSVPADPRVQFVEQSITDDEVLKSLPQNLDFAWQLACYHGNQSSIADPLADHENGTMSSIKLFNRLKDMRSIRKVVYSAAGCAVAEKTYDAPAATREDAPLSLFHDSPYSISKLAGELYGNYFFQHFGLPFVKARFQNVYGPGEILGAGRWRGTPHTVWRNVVPTFVLKALHGEALPLDNAGTASRDFIFVGDVAEGLVACATRSKAGEAYNIASGMETTILELAALINELTENPTPHQLLPARDWDRSGRRFGDPTKSREELGFGAKTSLREGLASTVAWTRENLTLIRTCMAKHRNNLSIESYLGSA